MAKPKVSDAPWGDVTAADYTPEQWARACLVDTGQGSPDSKSRYKVPVREPDGTLSRGGIHAASGGHGLPAVKGAPHDVMQTAARNLIGLYRDALGEDPPPAVMELAGMSMSGGVGRSDVLPFFRTYPLETIEVVRSGAGGDGRTVRAYAALFDVETDIVDHQGRYREQIARSAFNRTIQKRGTHFGVFYNHGMTLHGTPSERASTPLGSLIEPPRADSRGLLTVVRYNTTSLADEILASIDNGDITGQSFSGRCLRSTPEPPYKGRYVPDGDGNAPLVTRHEIAMTEFGPTPIPSYEQPMLVSVRARSIVEQFEEMDPDDRDEIRRMLGVPTVSISITGDAGGPDSATPSEGLGSGDSRTQAHSARINVSISPSKKAAAARCSRNMEETQ